MGAIDASHFSIILTLLFTRGTIIIISIKLAGKSKYERIDKLNHKENFGYDRAI